MHAKVFSGNLPNEPGMLGVVSTHPRSQPTISAEVLQLGVTSGGGSG